MDKIIAALNSLVAAATAIRNLDPSDNLSNLRSCDDIAHNLCDQLREHVHMAILNNSVVVCPFNLDEQQMHFDNERIQAIRSLRLRTGMGLKEAKDLSDKFREENMYMDEISGDWYRR